MKDHWGYETESKPDIVEVVRCRNCRWGHYDDLLNVYWCDEVAHTDDFFCAIGERISNEALNGATVRKNAKSAPLTLEKCAETRKSEVQKCTKS